LSAEIASERVKAAKEQAERQARLAARQVRGGEAGEPVRRPARRGRRVASWTAAIVILAGGAGLAWHKYSGKPASSASGRPTVTANETASASMTATATGGDLTTLQPSAGPPADPFEGTPADHWADGPAGITLAAAKPVGTFTSAQVATVYATTRKILVAQNLDPTTLRGGKPAAFESLLTLEQLNVFLRGLDKPGVDKNGNPLSTRAWVASFAPGGADLVGTVIKVHGTMSARPGTDSGTKVLDVDVNYRFVYVVEPPGKPQDWMRIVGQVYGYVEFFPTQDPSEPLQPWIATAFPAEAGIQCATTDGFIHPDYPDSPPQSVQPSGPAVDPYSTATPQTAQTAGSCYPTTGT